MGNKAGKHHQKSSGTTTAAAITTTAPQPTVSSTPKPKPIPRKPKAVPTATPPFIPAATIEKNTKSKNTNTKTTKKMEGEGYGPPVNNVCEMIGNTPMIKLSDKMTGTPNVTIYAKAEYCNPLSSVKDRLAKAIIEDAEKSGKLKEGDTVVEATSGNTGIAIAMMCAQRGYKCVIVMAESFSIERRALMRMLGAKVILTPGKAKGLGMVEKAQELSELNGWFLCQQFETDANWKYHEKTTGPEIMNDLASIDTKLDYFVSGYGTGGTFHGVSKYIKAESPWTKCILAEPKPAPLVDSKIPTKRNFDGSPFESHPLWQKHPIQGWAPDFIALNLQKGLDLGLMDSTILIPDGVSVRTSKQLARNEGILTGISGGATVWAAIEVAKIFGKPGDVIVCILPDTGERYLSTPLFASITNIELMTEEEQSISESTPSHILH